MPVCLARPAGLLGFPPKDLQHRFLSFFKPVFYIRQRDYSKVRCGAGRGGVGRDAWRVGAGRDAWRDARQRSSPQLGRSSSHLHLHPQPTTFPSLLPTARRRPPPTAHRLLPRRAWRWHLSSSTTVVPCSESTRGLGRLCCGRTTACTRAWQVRGWHAVRGTVWPHGLQAAAAAEAPWRRLSRSSLWSLAVPHPTALHSMLQSALNCRRLCTSRRGQRAALQPGCLQGGADVGDGAQH